VTSVPPCSNTGGAGIASQVVLTQLSSALVAIPITIRGQLADANGDPVHVAGQAIDFSDGNGNTVSCTTDATGGCQVSFTEFSTSGVLFTATVGSGPGSFGGSLQINAFGATSTAISASPASPTPIAANGTSSSTITVKVTDGGNNGVPGGVVKLSTTFGSFSGGCVSNCSALDIGGGNYTALLTSTTPGTATVTGTLAGTPVTGSASATFAIPLAPPTIVSGPPSLTNSATGAFTFTGVSGASFLCSLDDGTPVACASPFTTGALADGTHTFRVTQSDPDHPGSAPASFSWTIDTTPPAAPVLTSQPALSTGATSAGFTYTAEPGATVTCKLDGAPVPCTSSGASFTGLSVGPHTFEVFATDAAGNTGPAASYSWTINGPYAAPTIVTGPTTPTNTMTAMFTFTGVSGASFQCAVDAGAYAPCTSPFTTGTLADGTHTFRVTQSDGTHPVSAAASFSWTVDTVAPAPPVITSMPSTPTTSTVAAFTYTADAGAIVMCILDGTPVTCSATAVTLTGLAPGDHTFQVYATDAASNTSQPASYTWTIAAPSTGCPTGAGDVNGGLNVKGGLQINVEADCDAADKKHPAPYLHHAHLHVDGLGLKLEADTKSDNGKKGDITGVAFTRNADGSTTATITGTWNGKPFTLTVTDGGKKVKGQDRFSFTYDGRTYGPYTTPHGNVHVELE